MSDSKQRERVRLIAESHSVTDPDAMTIIVRFKNGDPVYASLSDTTGVLMVHTCFGTWGYQWSTDPEHTGYPTVSDFIGRPGRNHGHYVASKLMKSEEMREFDEDATKACYVELAKERGLGDEVLEELEEFDWSSFPHGYAPCMEHFDPYEMGEYKTSLTYLWLCEDILPVIFDSIRTAKEARKLDESDVRPEAKA